MAFWDRFRSRATATGEAAAAPSPVEHELGLEDLETHAKGKGVTVAKLIAPWQANRALPANDDFEALAATGYRRNAVIYACVRIKSSSLADPRLVGVERTREGAEPLSPDSPLQKLLDNPNEDMDQYEFLETLGMHYEIAGEFFVHKVRSSVGRVVELWPLRPDRVSPIPDSEGRIRGYEYDVGGGARKRELAPEDILHKCQADPVDDYRGLSPIHVAAAIAAMDNNSIDFLRGFFLNGGRPMGVIKVKGTVDRDRAAYLKLRMKEEYAGVQGWNGTIVMDEDVDYKDIGSKPGDLDMGSFFDVTEARLCQVWQVPPILVAARIGINRATYSNYASARRSFWDDTMAPLHRSIGAAFTRGVAREFGATYACDWDRSNVVALQENHDTLWTRALLGWNAGLSTLNEARTMIRLPRIEGGDIRKSALAGLGLEEPVVIEPQATQSLKVPKDLMELAQQLRLTIPELQKVIDRADPEDLKDAA